MLADFTGWCLVAYRADAVARRAMEPGDDGVTISRGSGHWRFTPAATRSRHPAGLVFFAGALVDPIAYAPLLRAVARDGHEAVLVELPRRGFAGGADGNAVLERARAAMGRVTAVREWVIAGHSRGGAVASRLVLKDERGVSGLVLIGTSHPRDFDLSRTSIAVSKVLGTRDGIARPEKSERNRAMLPPDTSWILVEGGNHSQFGCYGFQPGDSRATISREEQQRRTLEALLAALRSADTGERTGRE